jgi:hypothetical protein
MKHIESSVKITTTQFLEPAAVKACLMDKIKDAFHVETAGDGVENFVVNATGKSTSYVFSLNVRIKTESNKARIMISGSNEVSIATRIFYVVSLLLVLALSLFPNEDATPNMILVSIFFLVVGGFIIYDMNKKFEEPQQLIDLILKSVDAELG